jgi:hypothetical protein
MFDLNTSHDFYAMLVDDFDDYMAEPHSARRALHCAITAYHLPEWVWSDWLKKDLVVQKELGIRNKKDAFLSWVDRNCVGFKNIRDLANGSKHFRPNQGFETKRVTAAPFCFDQLNAGFDQGSFDRPMPYVNNSQASGAGGKGSLLIDHGQDAGDHRWMTAASLLEMAVRFWREFFDKYRPLPNLPISRCHID